MISKYLSIGTLAAGALIIGSLSQLGILTENTGSTDYAPRADKSELQASKARDAQGAAEITRMLLGDIETGEINAQGLSQLRNGVVKFADKQAERSGKSTELGWSEMGPNNVGGRTRALAFHPDNEDILYAGGVSGGLWRSVDQANTWEQVTSFGSLAENGVPDCNLTIGSIAIAGNGAWYKLTNNPTEMYASLMEILDEICKGGADEEN